MIKGEKLCLGYEGKTIVSDLDFSIGKGDYIAILGENGSGKSTLINTILGFKKPISGKIIFDGIDMKKGIGYLPQQSVIRKDFPATVKEVVLSGCLNYGKWSPFYTRAQKALAEKNMNILGLDKISKKSFSELSGGQKQRVLLARALCSTKDLIILDEPVSGLDPIVTAEMYDSLKKINDEGVTVVMVSHDVDSSVKYANKILYIDYEKSFFGTTEEYSAFIEKKEGDK